MNESLKSLTAIKLL